MWRFFRENPGAAIFAVLVHVVFAAALVLTLDGKTHTPAINPDAKIIKAKVIDEAKIKKERKRKETIKRKQEQERKKREAEKREEKRKAELKKKQELEKKKKLALNKKKEAEAKKKKLAAEKKRKAAELKKKQEEQERKQRIAEMQKQMDLELAREEAERKKQAKRAAQQKEVDRYQALIKQAISNKWRVPVSARIGQECILKLRLIPSGEVISVEVVKSSGDIVYDRSVESAVYKASPLPLPPAESDLFNEFREINVPFRLESRNS